MTPTGRYVVYGCDRAGTPWDIAGYDGPYAALERLNAEQMNDFVEYGPGLHRVFGVYDSQNPEMGDAQLMLEEMLSDDEHTTEWWFEEAV